MKERRYDIDWLRVLAMVAVFLFHCARFFDGGPWHLNNADKSIVAGVFVGWLDMWFMPLFFLLSGIGSWYSLKSRTNGRYLQERVKRILVPLYTVGLFLLLPPQFYFEMYSHEYYRGSFWSLLPRYFEGLGNFSWSMPDGLLPHPFSAHLWFLQYLFLISVVSLPLLRILSSRKGRILVDRLAKWSQRWGGIFLFLIPLILIRVGLRSIFLGLYTWASFVEFALFYVIGYMLPSDAHFTDGIKKHGWMCLILGILSYGLEGYFVWGLGYSYPCCEPFSMKFVLFEMVLSIGRWSWIIFILSLGAKYLNFNNKFLGYGNEAVLPFYILHQTIILCVGWFVIRGNMGILPKYLIIVVVSFTLIMLLYELLAKRFNAVRFFFGMRPKKKPPYTTRRDNRFLAKIQ